MRSISVDHYLKTIYRLERAQGAARNVDIARALRHSKPSVTRAVEALRRMGYVVKDARAIRLTPCGEEIARGLDQRYEAIHGFLRALGVSEPSAAHDACWLEHGISEETYRHLLEAGAAQAG